MKVTNIHKRTIIVDGKPIPPQESAIIPDNVDLSWELSMGKVRVEGMKIAERVWTKEELNKKKMSELRKIGEPFGAKDTSKSELIEEIIKKQR